MKNMAGMTRFGIGPLLAGLSIAYCLAAFVLTRYFTPLFNLDGVPDEVRLVASLAFLFIGVPFFVVAVIAVTRAYNAGRLVTTGIFGCCRHPVYGAWIVFIIPGMALMANSIALLSAPVPMYLLLRMLVKKEEKYLEDKFGVKYLNYRNNTPDIMPVGWIKRLIS